MRGSSIGTHHRAGDADPTGRRGTWTGYAACLWALLFAAITFYWALGGRIGSDDEPGGADAALLWASAVLKVLAGVLALALGGRMFESLPRWMLLTTGWLVSLVLLGYGLANLRTPVWVVGGVLFTLAALRYTVRPLLDGFGTAPRRSRQAADMSFLRRREDRPPDR